MRILRSAIPLLLTTALTAFNALGQSNCAMEDANRTAMLALGIQNKLLAHKIAPNDIEMDAPHDVEEDVMMLRKTLDIATRAFFRCEVGTESDPVAIQAQLSRFLHAESSARKNNFSEQDNIYGANLHVQVEPAEGLIGSLFVVLTFDIECGDDNMLFLYKKSDGQWLQQLHWYSDKYTKPSDAFGDFFLYKAVPGPINKTLLIVAHGHPWCTSRWSGFEIDLLEPNAGRMLQTKLGHFSAGYDRASDESLELKKSMDGFVFKFWTNEAVAPRQAHQMSGPMSLKFQTTAGTLKCISKHCLKK